MGPIGGSVSGSGIQDYSGKDHMGCEALIEDVGLEDIQLSEIMVSSRLLLLGFSTLDHPVSGC